MSPLSNTLVFAMIIGICCSTSASATRTLGYLEQFELSQLNYWLNHSINCGEEKVVKAVVLDPQGFAHDVRIGDEIGKHWGMVREITDEYIEVEEVYHDKETGEWVARMAYMPSSEIRYKKADENLPVLEIRRKIGKSEIQQREQLTNCKERYAANDAKRLACFDTAVATR